MPYVGRGNQAGRSAYCARAWHVVAVALIPELTRVAWRTKKEEMTRRMPDVQASAFVFRYTRRQYEQDFGAGYRRPGFIARFIGIVYRVVPKIGPLRPLGFKTPSAEAERLFIASFRDTRARYAAVLRGIGARRLDLANTDLDTGKPSARGEYELADKTYFELLEKLAQHRFENLPPALGANITEYYSRSAPARLGGKDRKRAEKIEKWLGVMSSRSAANVPMPQ